MCRWRYAAKTTKLEGSDRNDILSQELWKWWGDFEKNWVSLQNHIRNWRRIYIWSKSKHFMGSYDRQSHFSGMNDFYFKLYKYRKKGTHLPFKFSTLHSNLKIFFENNKFINFYPFFLLELFIMKNLESYIYFRRIINDRQCSCACR